MHVQQVKTVSVGDFGHTRRQRQIIRRVFKQRILRNRNLVVADVVLRSAEPNRLRVGNEMNLVSTPGQLNAQLSSHNATAAVCGIASDTDLHKPKEQRGVGCPAPANGAKAEASRDKAKIRQRAACSRDSLRTGKKYRDFVSAIQESSNSAQ